MDTMVLVQVYRRDERLVAIVDAVLDGRTILLIPDVVSECFGVFNKYKPDTTSGERVIVSSESEYVYEHCFAPLTREDLVVDSGSRDEFNRLLVNGLEKYDMDFVAYEPESETYKIARNIHAQNSYKNKKGEPLSLVDCTLLLLAIENQNINVLTDDSALTRAIHERCGESRVASVLNDYFGRLNMTARFLGRMLNVRIVDCVSIRDRIEYHLQDSGKGSVAGFAQPQPSQHHYLDQSPSLILAMRYSPDCVSVEAGPIIRNLKHGNPHNVLAALIVFFEQVVLDWYCACGGSNEKEFGRGLRDVKYTYDNIQITTNVNKQYYAMAKGILIQNRKNYCACASPARRNLHKKFREIMSETAKS